ncbi:hypothetical protein Sjap_006746 [Stephania japonica]|uniref:Uncharacterized protein n=1 Tax=Stephania japonica TaxID=461633 RepID=A0AAP0PJ81_9MAGN
MPISESMTECLIMESVLRRFRRAQELINFLAQSIAEAVKVRVFCHCIQGEMKCTVGFGVEKYFWLSIYLQ